MTMEDANLQSIAEVLLSYEILDDFHLQDVPTQGFQAFLGPFSSFIEQKYQKYQAVDFMCLISVINYFNLHFWDRDDDTVMISLINLLPWFKMKNISICRTLDLLRISLKKIDQPSEKSGKVQLKLPLNLHAPLLSAMHSRIITDDPPHIFFPGDKESFLQVSSIPWQCATGYSFLIWLKIPSTSAVKGFEIFRCRNPQLTIDAAMIYIPEEGSYTIRIVTNSERRGRDEIRGKLLMSADSWHLLSIKHTNPKEGTDQMIVAIDGNVFIETELNFPSATVLNNESHWTFGMGFHGLMAAVTFYDQDLPNSTVKFIHALGPYVTELKQGVSFPQSSYDSGHTLLGTQISKGSWAAKLASFPVAFNVTALVVSAGGTFAQSRQTDSNNFYVEMVPQTAENDSPVVVSITGKGKVSLCDSCVVNVLEGGGVGLFLYLLWSYCTCKLDDLVEEKEIDEVKYSIKECVLMCMENLAALIKAHADLKEQFIQLHGFHLVAHCLSSASTDLKGALVCNSLVDACTHLVEALGSDGMSGDGIASAMQGLLFDFRVWGYCDLPTLKHFLESISSICLKAGDQLYKCIGMQKLLDIFRVHVSKVLNQTSKSSESSKLILDLSPEQLAKDCANEIHRMMIIIKDAAVESALKSRTDAMLDTDFLLICLAETSSCYLAERILRLMSNIKVTNPTILQKSLIYSRFYDTVLIALWMRKGLSLEVRSGGLTYLIWLLGIELREIPLQIIQLRKSLTVSNASSKGGGKRNKGNSVVNDPQKFKMLYSQIKDQTKPLKKWWKTLQFLADTMSKAIFEGVWGDLGPCSLTTYANKDNADLLSSTISEQLDNEHALSFIVQEIAVNYQRETWLLLPFLPPLISRVDIGANQKVLMQMNIQFKTDEAQCEALSNMDNRSWIDILVQLAVIGEVQSATIESNSSDQAAARTCTELALEILSIALDYKIKYHPNNNTNVWYELEESLSTTCKMNLHDTDLALDADKRLLRRCVSLILQRVVKSVDEYWNTLTFATIDSLFCLISARALCGVISSKEVILPSNPKEVDLLGLDEESSSSAVTVQIPEETNMLSLVLDVLRSARKVSTKVSYGGGEWSLLRNGFLIILSCLAITPDELHERLDEEILGYVNKVCDPSAPFSAADFTKLIMQVLFTLKAATYGAEMSSGARTKYTGTILEIIVYFTELRRGFITKSQVIPNHMEDVINILAMVENFNDISLIFEVLEAMMKERNVLSAVSAFEAEKFAISPEDPNIIDYTSVPDAQDNLINFALLEEYPLLTLAEGSAAIFPEITKADLDLSPSFSQDTPLDNVSVSSKTSNKEHQELPENPVVAEPSSYRETESRNFVKWLKIRQGIIAERVDTERARLTRIMNAQDLSAEATKKFWKKYRRKLETESFGESHRCQWKLGVAHEGNFPGRKRILLRPRYDNIYQVKVDVISVGKSSSFDEAEISSDELNRALARQCSGYIRDVTRSEVADTKEEQAYYKTAIDGDVNKAVEVSDLDTKGTPIPGTGWGIVDADGSDEGFGVVGLIQDPAYVVDEANASKKAAVVTVSTKSGNESEVKNANGEPSLVGDMMGDVHILEENLRSGRTIVETGPCHSGTYRVGSGLTKLEARVVMVTASGNFWGFLSFNGKEIFYRSSFEQEDVNKYDNAAVNLVKEQRMRRRRWLLTAVSSIYLRRFRLRDSALEVFFRRGKHRNFFVDFGHTKENAKQRNEFAKALMQAAPNSAFKQLPGMTPFRMVYEHGVQEKWLAGKMSNFDYLMALNTLAGRSYNDLCQYPVMPWIIADYHSESIDLKNPKVYRDLSLPMGALNENRFKEFLSRFESFEDNISTGIPAFMYGSHYSTMVGVVLHFLVRLQPFAALHREMQNGHFDVSDRLFSSIPRSFAHNTTQLSEVKELIPEWFTTPDMFRNVNKFDFGRTQDGDSIQDVELPPWAKSPEDFVRIHREALESDYVTENLHNWIDLIFGYKQRGPDAVDAKNVFYYLTYYGAVDYYMIEDETLRRATELQIAHFGQTPMQLFKTPHPARKISGNSSILPITRSLKANFNYSNAKEMRPPRCDEETIAMQSPCTLICRKNNNAVIQQTIFLDRIVCILENGVVEVLKYFTSDEAKAALAIRAAINAEQAKAPHARNKARKNSALEEGTGSSQSSRHDPNDLLDLTSPNEAIAGGKKTSGSKSTSDSIEDVKEYSAANYCFLREGEVLVYVEKEYAHFDVVPRIPLPRQHRLLPDFIQQGGKINSTVGQKDYLDQLMKVRPLLQSSLSNHEKLSQLVVFSRSSRLCLVAGRVDGAVMVREFDERTGSIRSAGEFTAHHRRVVSIALDTNPPEYDVAATVDEAGTILVWTVMRNKSKQITQHPIYIISHRPQRLFRCDPPELRPEEDVKNPLPMQIDISFQMGVVAVVSGESVYIYSIERNELLRRFVLACFSKNTVKVGEEDDFAEYSYNGPKEFCLEQRAVKPLASRSEDFLATKYFPRRMVLSEYGMIIINVESFLYIETAEEFEEQLHQQHLLLAHTVSGVLTASIICTSPVTCLTCPDRGEVVISGHADGAVRFYRVQDLALLYEFYPHSYCSTVSLGIPGSAKANANQPPGMKRKSNSDIMNTSLSVAPAPIVSITVGPNRAAPTTVCMTTDSGCVFVKALPDFVRWEKQRQPSALAQLVNSAPLQAVKGTLLQAHNWTQETASAIAQNAKFLADDAVTELKKLQRSSIVKGVASFFGVGKSASSDESSKQTNKK